MVLVVALAGWVGLSPTADALTRSATIVGFMQGKASCQAKTEGCGTGPSSGCCASRTEQTAEPTLPACQARTPQPMPDCDSHARTGRCCQCYLLGGLLLFTAGEPAADPDLQLLGRIEPGNHPPVVRNLVPPVPPPIGDLDHQVV